MFSFESLVVVFLVVLFAVLSLLPSSFKYSEEEALVQLQD